MKIGLVLLGQRTASNSSLHDVSRVKYLHAYIGSVLDSLRYVVATPFYYMLKNYISKMYLKQVTYPINGNNVLNTNMKTNATEIDTYAFDTSLIFGIIFFSLEMDQILRGILCGLLLMCSSCWMHTIQALGCTMLIGMIQS